ncbi:MAG: DUF4382 domain-containing protein [Rhodothermales bacterium]|nr:DUF4382 domain-containing protein [Rhodothermales bacterium]
MINAHRILVIALCGVILTGCDSADNTSVATVSIKLTDMPFPFDDADSANVVIQRVELIGSEDSTSSLVISDSLQPFNLLDLQNGVTADLASLDIPVGSYSQLRIVVLEDASVVMKDSTSYNLKIPSGSETGIKINLSNFDLQEADSAIVTVDFNVEESFVVRGNPSTVKDIMGFIFKPVLKIESYSLNGVPQTVQE